MEIKIMLVKKVEVQKKSDSTNFIFDSKTSFEMTDKELERFQLAISRAFEFKLLDDTMKLITFYYSNAKIDVSISMYQKAYCELVEKIENLKTKEVAA